MKSNKNIIIAIDGFSSCGKSTLARAIAEELKFIYIDSGAMYRAVTVYFLDRKIPLDDKTEINSALERIRIDFHDFKVYLNHYDVSDRVRDLDISNYVPYVSALSSVRESMIYLQRAMGFKNNIIMDGRDIGSIVFPNAQIKIFMTADPRIRAERRFKEMKKRDSKITIDEVLESLIHRDHKDQNRKESPLIRPIDAIILDNTYLSKAEQLKFIMNKISLSQDFL